MADINQIILRKHPEYDRNFLAWKFFRATYDGGKDWFCDNIFKYYKEGDDEYTERLDRAYRFNHTREVVDLINKYIFKAEISRREDAPAYLRSFWQNATLQKRDIDHFMNIASTLSSIYGRVWVVIDTDGPNGTFTLAEAKKLKSRVYCYSVTPTDVLDLSFGEDGELNWIKIREAYRDDENPFEYSGKIIEKIRVWTRDSWYLYRSSVESSNSVYGNTLYTGGTYELEASGKHGLGIVPVTYLDHNETESPFTSTPLIADIAYLDRAAANYLSNLDAIIQDQTFSQLVIPAEAIAFSDQDDTNLGEKLLEFGTKRIFLYHGGDSGMAPDYISPDPKQAGVILAVVNKIISEIYHSVGMAGERTKQDNAMGIDNSSGVAKAYDFERMNAMLANKAKALEFCENRIARIVAAWNNVFDSEDVQEVVSYSRDFDVRNLSNELDIATQLATINAPKTLRAEQMKSVVNKLYPQLSEQLKAKIEKDIDGEWSENLTNQAKVDAGLKAPAQAPQASGNLPKGNGKQGQNNKSAK